jgi:hypothetical protein
LNQSGIAGPLDSHEFHGNGKNRLMWRYPTFAGFADLPDLFLAHLRAAGKHGACFTSRREQVPRSEEAVIRRLDFIAPKLAPCPTFCCSTLTITFSETTTSDNLVASGQLRKLCVLERLSLLFSAITEASSPFYNCQAFNFHQSNLQFEIHTL